MSHQKPEDQAALAMFKAMKAMEHGPLSFKVSGTQLVGFREGWAIPALRRGDAVHHLRIIGDGLVGACGVSFPLPHIKGQGVVLFGQGDFRRCKRCQRAVDRRGGGA